MTSLNPPRYSVNDISNPELPTSINPLWVEAAPGNINDSSECVTYERKESQAVIGKFMKKWGIDHRPDLVDDSTGNPENAMLWHGTALNAHDETVVVYVEPLDAVKTDDRRVFWGLIHKSELSEETDPETFAEHAIYEFPTNPGDLTIQLTELTRNIDQHSKPIHTHIEKAPSGPRQTGISVIVALALNLEIARRQVFPSIDDRALMD